MMGTLNHEALKAGNDVTVVLADFVVNTRVEDVPGQVRSHAVKSVFNGIGTALGGSSDQAVRRLLDTFKPYMGSGTATLIGHATQTDAPMAAFINAVAMNVFDFDDTHEGTIIHPTAPVAPALFALAEQQRISGAELIHAFALGAEVECRIGRAISPSHYKRGWHITSTCGVFGAAVAVGKLIGLTREQMIWAIGNAAAQSAGLVETLGSMAKSVSVGNAARNGYLAAHMARHGVAGPALPLEGERGFLRLFCDRPDFDATTGALMEHWELLHNAFKPYPCGVVLNPVIDACLTIRGQAGFAVDRIAEIEVAGNSLLKERTDRPNVATGREAQVSAQHAVAVSLLRGSAGIADFNDDAVARSEIARLRAKVAPLIVDEAMKPGSARVIVRFIDGAILDEWVAEATGSLARPLGNVALKNKFRALADYGCPGLDPNPLMDALWTLDRATDAGSIMGVARPRK